MAGKALKEFSEDDAGAVTVDWVVLTAALVGVAFAVFTVVTRETLTVGAQFVSDTIVGASEYKPDFAPGEAAPESDEGATPDGG